MAKVALVTGAGQGIGQAIALRLARDGFTVALVDVNTAAITELQHSVTNAGGQARSITADLTQISQLPAVFAQSLEFGELSVLVNNAGRVFTRPFLEVTEEEWDLTLALDLKTVFFMIQCAAPRMPTGSRIVNIASISGRSGRADQAPYAAAKAGVINLTRSAALALASQSITVNAVCPGIVDTPLTRSIHESRAHLLGITPDESLARMIARIPLGRLETTDDVASAVSFLCSPEAAYITGQSLNVCGGMEMD